MRNAYEKNKQIAITYSDLSFLAQMKKKHNDIAHECTKRQTAHTVVEIVVKQEYANQVSQWYSAVDNPYGKEEVEFLDDGLHDPVGSLNQPLA